MASQAEVVSEFFLLQTSGRSFETRTVKNQTYCSWMSSQGTAFKMIIISTHWLKVRSECH